MATLTRELHFQLLLLVFVVWHVARMVHRMQNPARSSFCGPQLRTVFDWTPRWGYTFDRGEAISW